MHDSPRKWGCNAEVERPRWNVLCHTCMGEGKISPKEICPTCEGQKMIPQFRCPTVANTGTMNYLFRQFREFKQYSILPNSGGFQNQTATFMKVLRFCEYACSVYDSILTERKEAFKKRAKSAKV